MRRPLPAVIAPVAAVAAAFLASAPATAGVVLRASPREMADTAHLVIEGRVAAIDVRWNAGRTSIDTWVDFTVDRVHKGSAGLATVRIKVPGGRVGDDELRVDGVARFTEGEEAVVFLWRDGHGDYQVLGEAQGKFRLFRDGRTDRRLAENSLSGLCLVIRGGAKGLADAAARRPDRLAYDELAAIVRDSVAGLPRDPVRDRIPGETVARETPSEAPAAAPAAPTAGGDADAATTGAASAASTTSGETENAAGPDAPEGDEGGPAPEVSSGGATAAPVASPPSAGTTEPAAFAGRVLAVRGDGTLALDLSPAATPVAEGARFEVVGAETLDVRAVVRVLAGSPEAPRAAVVSRPANAPAVLAGDRLRPAPVAAAESAGPAESTR